MTRTVDISLRREALQKIVAHVTGSQFADLSLRTLARATGTSARMLLYHFESKERLLSAVVQEICRQEREMAQSLLAATQSLSPASGLKTLWKELTDPAREKFLRTFFEVYGLGLNQRASYEEFFRQVVTEWIAMADHLLKHKYPKAADRSSRSVLMVAVFRGLLLDLLATGEKLRVEKALDQFCRWLE